MWVASQERNSQQVLDAVYKSRLYSQCVQIEERKKNGRCSMLEYLHRYINHKSHYFTNYDGSAQGSTLCKIFNLSLQNISAKTFRMAAGQIYTLFFYTLFF